tara:strand:+ start:16586 stop:16945 length:360 start_codon:yes stop_codon:yes gene_type:complete
VGISSVNVRGDIFRARARDGGSTGARVDVRVARVFVVVVVVVVVERDRAREGRRVVGGGERGDGVRARARRERRDSTRVQSAAAGVRRRVRVDSKRGRARAVGVDRSERGGVLRMGDDG